MEKKTIWRSEYFYGERISAYGLDNGFLDYGTLSKAFPHILNNSIYFAVEDFYLVSGCDYNEETEEYADIYQWFIVDENGAEIIEEFTDDPLYYSESLDCYLWAVTHFGTSWDYVLTSVKLAWIEK